MMIIFLTIYFNEAVVSNFRGFLSLVFLHDILCYRVWVLLASQPPSSGTVLTRICQAGLSPLCLPVLKGNTEIFGSSESFGMRKSPPRHWFEMCHRTSCLFLVNSRWKLCLPSSPFCLHTSICVTQRMGEKTQGY